MWWHLLTGLFFFSSLDLSSTDVFSNRYCPDMNPQFYVTIEQLMGMWYGVEIISHKQNEQRFGVRQMDSCPIIHISEDNSPTTPPYYNGFPNYPHGLDIDTTYQQRNDYNTQGPYGPYNTNYGQTYQQDRNPYGGSTPYQGRQYGTPDYGRRYAEDIKRLRLLWDENGDYVEYTVRYNVSKPGFWISSGPQNGSSLENLYNHFAGTIQVIKAVGNQLVLTFCRQLPDQQLYTALLSRVPRLTRTEISDIHDLLTKRGLETHNIRKVCTQNGSPNLKINTIFMIASLLLVFRNF